MSITARHYAAMVAIMLLCCLECSAEAAEPVSAREALAVLCPARVSLAPVFDRAARRYGLPPAFLVSVSRNESNCNPHAVGKGG